MVNKNYLAFVRYILHLVVIRNYFVSFFFLVLQQEYRKEEIDFFTDMGDGKIKQNWCQIFPVNLTINLDIHKIFTDKTKKGLSKIN